MLATYNHQPKLIVDSVVHRKCCPQLIVLEKQPVFLIDTLLFRVGLFYSNNFY